MENNGDQQQLKIASRVLKAIKENKNIETILFQRLQFKELCELVDLVEETSNMEDVVNPSDPEQLPQESEDEILDFLSSLPPQQVDETSHVVPTQPPCYHQPPPVMASGYFSAHLPRPLMVVPQYGIPPPTYEYYPAPVHHPTMMPMVEQAQFPQNYNYPYENLQPPPTYYTYNQNRTLDDFNQYVETQTEMPNPYVPVMRFKAHPVQEAEKPKIHKIKSQYTHEEVYAPGANCEIIIDDEDESDEYLQYDL